MLADLRPASLPLSVSLNNLTDCEVDLLRCQRTLGDRLPFVEILWDNYCHLDPEEIGSFLTTIAPEISLHVMWSRFLERSDDDLDALLARLAEHVRVLRPRRVSDHLCQFVVEGVLLGHGVELLPSAIDHVARRIERYQRAIGQQLLLENFASTSVEGAQQVELLAELARLTGCGLLFDVSNAAVAELNGVRAALDWCHLLGELGGAPGHVGGYVLCPETQLHQDSHGHRLTPVTLELLERVLAAGGLTSLCYEREHDKVDDEVAADLLDLLRRCA